MSSLQYIFLACEYPEWTTLYNLVSPQCLCCILYAVVYFCTLSCVFVLCILHKYSQMFEVVVCFEYLSDSFLSQVDLLCVF